MGFEKRNPFASHKPHSEVGAADIGAAELQPSILQGIIQQYGENNVHNAYETGSCFRLPRNKLLVHLLFQERRDIKNEFVFFSARILVG